MPEIRQNIATGEWVIIATERSRRPNEFVQARDEQAKEYPSVDPNCPFCPGNEEPALERLRIPRRGAWQVRVVRNKYPALQEDGELAWYSDGFNRSLSGIGYHEVVIESRAHNTWPALQSVKDLERTLLAFQIRGELLRADPQVQQIVYFKNHGLAAGTSMVHPHSQLVGLPVVPHSIRGRIEMVRRYFDEYGECVICRMLEEEERQQVRVLIQSRSFCAFLPYASYSPFHLWIVPRRHMANFLDMTTAEVHDLAQVLHEVLRRLYVGLNDPDYNYVVRSAPERGPEYELADLHWYVAVIPRVTRTAGFEMGSGMFINTASPEESAEFLRSVVLP